MNLPKSTADWLCEEYAYDGLIGFAGADNRGNVVSACDGIYSRTLFTGYSSPVRILSGLGLMDALTTALIPNCNKEIPEVFAPKPA